MKIAIVLGTRPEIIKMSPVIRECIKRNLDYFIIHTGQHYSENMDKVFFEELELPVPKYNLGVGIHPYNKQIGKMVKEIPKITPFFFSKIRNDFDTIFSGKYFILYPP